MRFVVGLVALFALGCTKENPHACGDGTCNDPRFPFCDTGGTLGGAVNECVAVSCTPGAFAECRGGTSVVCDATGANYELQKCVRGCDDATGGCRIDPSNDLGHYFDMVPDPPDMEVINGTIDTSTGLVNGENTIPNFLEASPSGGVPIRVFVVRRARIVDASVASSNIATPPPALAILATEDITIESFVTFPTEPNQAAGAVLGGRYGNFNPDCTADRGTCDGSDHIGCSGGGGGGNATAGAAGGSVTTATLTVAGGGSGGAPLGGNDDLVPLRGGCASYGAANIRGQGGGAIQLSSSTRIRVLGRIDVRGEPGGRQKTSTGSYYLWEISGGGAGGGILVEAPVVELGPSAHLDAKGGAGASSEGDGGESDSRSPSLGGSCSAQDCGRGGNGAAMDTPPEAGTSLLIDTSSPNTTAGGGGGGLGRVRINSGDGTYSKSQTTIENAVVTAGVVRRR